MKQALTVPEVEHDLADQFELLSKKSKTADDPLEILVEYEQMLEQAIEDLGQKQHQISCLSTELDQQRQINEEKNTTIEESICNIRDW